jgi:hypothetical protein
VPGSRQFQDFEDYLLRAFGFRSMHSEERLGLSAPDDGQGYISERLEMLAQRVG